MAIIIGKFKRSLFSNADGDYHIISVKTSAHECANVVYAGVDPPKAIKTVQFSFFGEWRAHPKYGRQFFAERWERFEGKTVKKLTSLERAMRRSDDSPAKE